MIYKTIKDTVTAELIEKKSRFICILSPLNELKDIERVMQTVKQDHPGARHYCFAYRFRQDSTIQERCTDDDEPSGTAGFPMLNVLKNRELENIMAVVVRYFGGTLLGTGGLVRAYTGAVKAALEKINTFSLEYSQKIRATLDYTYYGSFENQLMNLLNQVTDIKYTDHVCLEAWIAAERLSGFTEKVDNLSNGTAVIEFLEEGFVPQR